jgi:hypothetical protein
MTILSFGQSCFSGRKILLKNPFWILFEKKSRFINPKQRVKQYEAMDGNNSFDDLGVLCLRRSEITGDFRQFHGPAAKERCRGMGLG